MPKCYCCGTYKNVKRYKAFLSQRSAKKKRRASRINTCVECADTTCLYIISPLQKHIQEWKDSIITKHKKEGNKNGKDNSHLLRM